MRISATSMSKILSLGKTPSAISLQDTELLLEMKSHTIQVPLADISVNTWEEGHLSGTLYLRTFDGNQWSIPGLKKRDGLKFIEALRTARFPMIRDRFRANQADIQAAVDAFDQLFAEGEADKADVDQWLTQYRHLFLLIPQGQAVEQKLEPAETALCKAYTQIYGNTHGLMEQRNQAWRAKQEMAHYQTLRPRYQKAVHYFERHYKNRYLRPHEIAKWRKLAAALFEEAPPSKMLRQDLPAEDIQLLDQFQSLMGLNDTSLQSYNQTFVDQEAAAWKDYFDTVESNPLTNRQREACLANGDRTLVLAGAGSGKTSVIIAKAGYLIQANMAKPEEILILAYNRKAAEEVSHRLAEKLPNGGSVVSKTFHALGSSILNENGSHRVSVMTEEEVLNEFIQGSVKAIGQDPKFRSQLLEYFTNHLKPTQSPFEFEEEADYWRHLSEQDYATLQNEVMKSGQEVTLANFFYVNDVNYEYEPMYPVDTTAGNRKQYRPDFYLPDHDIYIEHFALNKDGKAPPKWKGYEAGRLWKLDLHKTHGTTLVETFSYEFTDKTVLTKLQKTLEDRGVVFSPKPMDEIFGAVTQDGTPGKFDALTLMLAKFLNIFKSSIASLDSYRKTLTNKAEDSRFRAFLELFSEVLNRYEDKLRKTRSIDFNDMIGRAIPLISRSKQPYRYIMVDEFQDISPLRAAFLKALIGAGQHTALFCVGDDWQGINRFSGSDLSQIVDFEHHFGRARTVALDLTFRYNSHVNDFANTFVLTNPNQIQKQVKSIKAAEELSVSLVYFENESKPALEAVLEDILKRSEPGASVYLLGRYKRQTKRIYTKDLEARFGERLTFQKDTIHSSKGKEADFVIVLDMGSGRLNAFPGRTRCDPILTKLRPELEDYPHEEERRLFYVALTRCKQHVYVLCDNNDPSVFIEEIRLARNKSYRFLEMNPLGVTVKPLPTDCPRCGTGQLRFNKKQWQCSNTPWCDLEPRHCNQCQQAPLLPKEQGFQCANESCGHFTISCPVETCDGVLVKRSGQYGDFFGCIHWKEGCKKKLNPCPHCANAPFTRQKYYFECESPDCDHRRRQCSKCHTGWLDQVGPKQTEVCSNRNHTKKPCDYGTQTQQDP